MNKITIATVMFSVLGGIAARGQTVTEQKREGPTVFQYVFSNDGKALATPTGDMVLLGSGSLGGKVVTGKPFIGTEERHSVHMLGDGTRIETTDTDKIYRDDQGRTRIERDNGKLVTIQDPVSGMTAELNTSSKTVSKSVVRATFQARPAVSAEAAVSSPDEMKKRMAEMEATAGRVVITRSTGATAGGEALQTKIMAESTIAGKVAGEVQLKTPKEELGTQMVNGVMAQGSRTTLVIPAGQIGNDRAIRVVGEQWYSNDLQMMVKSSNSDPRFGDNTYQLTGVVQVSPDPSLFQIPADYLPRR